MIECPNCRHCFHPPGPAEAKFIEMVDAVKKSGFAHLMTWDHFVPPKIAAEFIGKTEKTLTNWRYNYEHQELWRLSGRSVQYSLREVAIFLTQ